MLHRDVDVNYAPQGVQRALAGCPAMRQMPEYRADEMIQPPVAWTSQSCSACSVIDADSRCSEARCVCTACGHAQSGDRSAVRDLLASVIGATALRGAFALVTPVIREMVTVFAGVR